MTHKESHLALTSPNQLLIPTLNPDQSAELWIDVATSQIQGALWFSCTLIPFDETREIHTLQRDPGATVISKYKVNSWAKIIYIQPKLELLQTRTNILIFILTLIVFIDSLIGIKEIAKSIIQVLVWALTNLTNMLSTLVK